MARTRTTINGAREYISKGELFNSGNFDATPDFRYGFGILPGHLRRFAYQHQAEGVDYVVYSYVTPIAWRRTDGTWIYPEVSYSNSTSRHQGSVRMALHGQHAVQPGGLKLDR